VSATRREAERALRNGDIALAVELYAVAEAIQAEELRGLELRQLLEPELFSGCACDGSL